MRTPRAPARHRSTRTRAPLPSGRPGTRARRNFLRVSPSPPSYPSTPKLYPAGVSGKTVVSSTFRVVKAIKECFPTVIEMAPRGPEKAKITKKFADAGWPGAIGIIDVCKVPIVVGTSTLRAGRRDAFVDRKGTICLSFQFIVDASYKILNISGGLRGSVSDVTVWNSSAVCKNLSALMGPKEWLFADMGYPLRSFMLSGYRKNEMGAFAEGKTFFNVLFSGTRNIVERV